jgi:uncharacterized protein YkwD
MRFLKTITATLSAALAAGALAGPAAAATCPGSDLRPAADNLATIRAATLCLLNGERTAAGLGTLTENAKLTQASTNFSAAMVRQHFFDHVAPGGSTLGGRLTVIGYLGSASWWIAGENIAWAQTSLSTPAEVMKAWMASEGHRENILEGRFREVGLGVVLGSPQGDAPNNAATYTTDFGAQADSAPAAKAAPKQAPHAAATKAPDAAAKRAATARRKAQRTCARKLHRSTGKKYRSCVRKRLARRS